MKVLVDSSIWLDHFRHGIRELGLLMEKDVVSTHPFVVGELACGNLKDRKAFLASMAKLDTVPTVTLQEVLHLLEANRLAGQGLDWVDVNLLGSALVAGNSLWTRDKALHKAAEKLRIAFYS